MNYDENRIKSIKAHYPAGTRIQLDSMNDPQAVESGTLGTVIMVDDIGDLIMKWDNGRSLNLIPGEDSFSDVPPETEQATKEQESHCSGLAEGLPELCFSVLHSTGDLICIKRGESGYYPSDWSTGDKAHNQELADYNNERLGVTDAQRQAMECGSTHGWAVPGADPKTYEQKPTQAMTMGGM